MARNIEDIFKMNGCSNHCAEEREEHDFYSTDPDCVRQLLEKEQFSKTILEPCCGTGNISETLKEAGYEVTSTDLIDRGYVTGGVDFFEAYKDIDMDIVTNPPYGLATEFVIHALKELRPHRKMALFLKLNFLEGVQRYKEIFSSRKYLKTVYVYSKRVACYKNDEHYQRDKAGNLILDAKGNPKKIGSAVAFCWLVFDTDYVGNPSIDWINTED